MPLHITGQNNSTDTVKVLLECNAEIEARNVNYRTPLHEAAWNNSTETEKILLERGAAIKERD